MSETVRLTPEIDAAKLDAAAAGRARLEKFFVDTITLDASTAAIVEMLVAPAKDLQIR